MSGRVNAIAVDPVSPTIAYFGSVGGGVWKTANCCSASTTWTPVTDDPLLATIAIDDLSIDPGNHNIVYAATGDLNFGSFSLGSAARVRPFLGVGEGLRTLHFRSAERAGGTDFCTHAMAGVEVGYRALTVGLTARHQMAMTSVYGLGSFYQDVELFGSAGLRF